MAGSDSRFDAANFRTKIRDTMTMGLPTSVSDRATFRWDTTKTYAIKDPKGKPYDYTEPPATVNPHADVQVPVAVEASSGSVIRTAFTPAGEMNDRNRVIITILDVDYDLVSTANVVLLGGNTYHIDYWAPPMGLFDVSIFQCYLIAMDES